MDTAGLTGLIMQPLQTLRNPYIQQQHYGVAPSGADEAPDTPPSKRVARAVMSGTTRYARIHLLCTQLSYAC